MTVCRVCSDPLLGEERYQPKCAKALFGRYAWWIGIGDLHLKNLSLLVDDQGIVKLSPADDLIATRLSITDDDLAMSILGSKQKL